MVNSLRPLVLFDDAHGQPNWQQTGFTSREIHTNFSGLAQCLDQLGAQCRRASGQSLTDSLNGISMLIIPPSTGRYDLKHARWNKDFATLFKPEEIRSVLRFVDCGGSLLAFAYRFGDFFTQTNLGDLVSALGCLLNDDAVVDLDRVARCHPLKSKFQTTREFLPPPWAFESVDMVVWRSTATFTILNAKSIRPLALSPGGRCITFNRTHRQISFQSLPIAVAGLYGAGRFAFFGGPHVFETGMFGLLTQANNRRFLQNVVRWLLFNRHQSLDIISPLITGDRQRLADKAEAQWREVCQIDGQGKGEPMVTSVERMLRRTGTLKALSHAHWAP